MIQKVFDQISTRDVDSLVSEKIMESNTLEYKQELPGAKDEDKKEFLADVSSFANGAGGDILYGIKAAVDTNGKKTGEADSVSGITGITADAAVLRLEDLIRQGIDPRMRVQVKAISGWGGNGADFVILVRVPKSFASPHMVTFKGTSRFYSRNSAGKYQLDVREIKSAILATESQSERIKRFIQDRIGKIIANETPVQLESPHRLILHVIPIDTFLNADRLELSEYAKLSSFAPIGPGGYDYRYNFDGFMTWTREDNQGPASERYCQLFFDGVVEAVDADILRTARGDKPSDGKGFIASIAYEKDVIVAVSSYIKELTQLGVSGRFAVSLALLGCKGSHMSVNSRFHRGQMRPIDRDALIVPAVVFEEPTVDIARGLKPLFDSVWNACGFPGSLNYDKEGNWKPN